MENSINYKKTLQEKFNEYDRQNPQVYELFKKFTFKAIKSGHKRFSSEMVINQIRWYTMVETTGDAFKVNNNFKAYYSRKFIAEFPAHTDFFRFKTLRS